MLSGKGSKRRIRQIRWPVDKLIYLILLLAVITVLSVAAAVWLNLHFID